MSERSRFLSRRAQLGFESLEGRSLLSALHGHAHQEVRDHHPAVTHDVHDSVRSSQAKSVQSVHADSGQVQETRLTATLSDPRGLSPVTGTARYQSETEHGVVVSEFNVRVQGANPGDTLDVSIADSSGNSVSVGKITVAADGSGKLSLSTSPHENSQQAFPAGFPAITAGSKVVVTVTDPATGAVTTLASGALNPSVVSGGSQDDSHDRHADHAEDQQAETHLSASLSDAASGLTGAVKYENSSEHGADVSEFSVKVKGLKPGTTLDVSLSDGSGSAVSVGTIIVGKNGTGRLEFTSHPHENSQTGFPANFPVLNAGSKVTLSVIDTDTGVSTTIASAVLATPPAGKKSH